MTTQINFLPTVTSNLLWRFSPNRILDPNVKVIFRGLMALCYQTMNQECEVAFYRGDPRHRLVIEVREIGVSLPIYILNSVSVPVKIELGIQARTPDVNFYYQGSVTQFDRRTGHENDFRWLLDFESNDGYNRQLQKNRDSFNSKLFVRHGTFFTVHHTNSTFMSLGLQHFNYLGHVTKYVGNEIKMGPRDHLYLKINGIDVLAANPLDPAKHYEIHFLNECFDSPGHRCTDSDFGLNYEFIDQSDLPVFLRFNLVTLFAGADSAPTGLEVPKDFELQSNDSAPCMEVGFGQTDGFPPEH